MMRWLGTLAAVAVWLAGVGPSLAAEQIGSAVRVINRVTGDLEQTVRTLATGDGVQKNEAIEAAEDSRGELVLNDDSKLAVGPGARLVLDKFVYDPSKTGGTIGIELVKGAFRFVTGVARKNSYNIKTPVASITVRGTVFDIYVDGATGATLILLQEGAITVCNRVNECIPLENPCGVVAVPGTGKPLSIPGWNGVPAERRVAFETAFPFVVSPPSVDPQVRFERLAIETGACPKPDSEPPVQRADIIPAPPAAPPPPYTPEVPSPPREQVSMPPAPPLAKPTWTSVYVGVTVGGGWGEGDTDVFCRDPNGVFDTVLSTPYCRYPIETGALETRYDTSPSGVIGGVTAGYNFDAGPIVWGIEGDISRSDISGDDREERDVPPTSPGVRAVSQSLEWLGTLRARAGVTQDNVLLYGTAGLAVGRSHFSYDAEYSGGVAYARESDSRTSVGWTGGFGAEIALGLFSIKGEYLYYDLGSEKISADFFQAGNRPTPVTFEPDFENKGHIFRVGTNFRLN